MPLPPFAATLRNSSGKNRFSIIHIPDRPASMATAGALHPPVIAQGARSAKPIAGE
jgi:hypothetical protein